MRLKRRYFRIDANTSASTSITEAYQRANTRSSAHLHTLLVCEPRAKHPGAPQKSPSQSLQRWSTANVLGEGLEVMHTVWQALTAPPKHSSNTWGDSAPPRGILTKT